MEIEIQLVSGFPEDEFLSFGKEHVELVVELFCRGGIIQFDGCGKRHAFFGKMHAGAVRKVGEIAFPVEFQHAVGDFRLALEIQLAALAEIILEQDAVFGAGQGQEKCGKYRRQPQFFHCHSPMVKYFKTISEA